MDILLLGIIIFLFVLAVFDLVVGVSNDASNFLNSAIGSNAASFRTIIIVASIGVFIGAISSNGMMDIARHGIFRPEYYSFYDLICVFMAVMVTDIILLDIFNSLGMPTSTTVSMVFELLGAAFVVALIKLWGGDSSLSLMNLLNTDKALSIILGIFLSVAIAFIFGSIVQFITRAIFSFEYKSNLKWKIGLFGGIAGTAIVWFMMIKGAKDLSWMTTSTKIWIDNHTVIIFASSFVALTIIMQALHHFGVNVLKVIVLIGTFALAMAFAGNDLVNFIGVPLSGLASYQDFIAAGSSDPSAHMMGVLNSSARTPIYFLLGAGCIMVVSLAGSKKALSVTHTSNNLSSQMSDDELFGSSSIARRIVRLSISIHSIIIRWIPIKVRKWIDNRFDTSKISLEKGASFDLIRASVNLMLAGMLIALGTSLKLPLSTTFVTFMVAMGTGLADRAWGRESAVFRITGVVSVIGGWFVTAGVAFIGAAIIAAVMHYCGWMAMIALALLTIVLIIRNNLYNKRKTEDANGDNVFQAILTADNKVQAWYLLRIYIAEQQKTFLLFAKEQYSLVANAFIDNDIHPLSKAWKKLYKEKNLLKSIRRKEAVGLRSIEPDTAIENSAWFHMSNNMCMSINYNLLRITEACKEHVENNFTSLPAQNREQFIPIFKNICDVLDKAVALVDYGDVASIASLRKKCDSIRDDISDLTHEIYRNIRNIDNSSLTVTYVFLNLLLESQEMISSLRKLLRASAKLSNSTVPVRRFSEYSH